jgi:hypothetical protein
MLLIRAGATLRLAQIWARNATHLEPALLITEIDENVLTAENSVRALVNLTHVMTEAVRYILSNNVERRVMVKPCTDCPAGGDNVNDRGGSNGNKTDPFVSIVYVNVMVQTKVINDSLSPMWMPGCNQNTYKQVVNKNDINCHKPLL